jgi:hypothetical protein
MAVYIRAALPIEIEILSPVLSRDLDYDPLEGEPLSLYGTDGVGRHGLLLASTSLRWLRVDVCWASERGDGDVRLAQALIAKAEEEARGRGCQHAFADCYDSRMVAVYVECGYEEFGRLEDYPARGHQRMFLRKALRPPSRARRESKNKIARSI